MRKVYLHYPDMRNGRIFESDIRDNCNDPYIALKRRLETLGYDLRTLDDHSVEDAEWVLFFNADSVNSTISQRLIQRFSGYSHSFRSRNVYRECVEAGLAKRIAIFLWEAPAVTPANWNLRLHKLFPILFTWHEGYIDGDRYHDIKIPQPRRYPSITPRPFRDKKLLVNISANKYRRHPRELYSERRKSIRHFENARPDDFDLYGVGWNKPSGVHQRLLHYTPSTYVSYRGSVTHKWDIYPHYRFALCYENVKDEPGYITEKIFDCMRADCVPIYWGSPNITNIVPPEAFVDRRQFNSNENLEHYLTNVSETEYEQYRSAIATFLNSDRFDSFLEDAFVDRVVSVLGLDARDKGSTISFGG